MEHITWDHNDLGISFAASSGRITIFKTTMKALNYPPYFRFLLDTDHKQFAAALHQAVHISFRRRMHRSIAVSRARIWSG